MTILTDVNNNEVDEVPTQLKPYPTQEPSEAIRLKDIPQGSGSKLDSDTIDGLNASTAQNPRPNTLVPLGQDGMLPASVIPQASQTFELLETQSPVASSSVTFTTTLLADTLYRLTWAIVQNTSNAVTQMRFNSDSGSNYKWSVNAFNTNGASVSASNNGDTEIQLTGNTQLASGDYSIGNVEFSSVPGDNTIIYGTYNNSMSDANPFLVAFAGALKYDGASVISSVTILPAAGTISGTLKLYKIN